MHIFVRVVDVAGYVAAPPSLLWYNHVTMRKAVTCFGRNLGTESGIFEIFFYAWTNGSTTITSTHTTVVLECVNVPSPPGPIISTLMGAGEPACKRSVS